MNKWLIIRYPSETYRTEWPLDDGGFVVVETHDAFDAEAYSHTQPQAALFVSAETEEHADAIMRKMSELHPQEKIMKFELREYAKAVKPTVNTYKLSEQGVLPT